ncbi:MAG TPA: adenosine-specific kinase, partial [Nitrososphaerales archaeon]|nr:adenosine-specific kinase [Nitrososphaerales archaeon]
MEIEGVDVAVPEGYQLILGQSHFIKTVEDLYEALATSMPGVKFGLAFCEASGKSLIRSDGSDADCRSLAVKYASSVRSGHTFVVVLSGAFPINVLNRIKSVQEVTEVFCATSNPVTVVVADTGKGRGVLGVVDGGYPKGEETESDAAERKEFLR